VFFYLYMVTRRLEYLQVYMLHKYVQVSLGYRYDEEVLSLNLYLVHSISPLHHPPQSRVPTKRHRVHLPYKLKIL